MRPPPQPTPLPKSPHRDAVSEGTGVLSENARGEDEVNSARPSITPWHAAMAGHRPNTACIREAEQANTEDADGLLLHASHARAWDPASRGDAHAFNPLPFTPPERSVGDSARRIMAGGLHQDSSNGANRRAPAVPPWPAASRTPFATVRGAGASTPGNALNCSRSIGYADDGLDARPSTPPWREFAPYGPPWPSARAAGGVDRRAADGFSSSTAGLLAVAARPSTATPLRAGGPAALTRAGDAQPVTLPAVTRPAVPPPVALSAALALPASPAEALSATGARGLAEPRRPSPPAPAALPLHMAVVGAATETAAPRRPLRPPDVRSPTGRALPQRMVPPAAMSPTPPAGRATDDDGSARSAAARRAICAALAAAMRRPLAASVAAATKPPAPPSRAANDGSAAAVAVDATAVVPPDADDALTCRVETPPRVCLGAEQRALSLCALDLFAIRSRSDSPRPSTPSCAHHSPRFDGSGCCCGAVATPSASTHHIPTGLGEEDSFTTTTTTTTTASAPPTAALQLVPPSCASSVSSRRLSLFYDRSFAGMFTAPFSTVSNRSANNVRACARGSAATTTATTSVSGAGSPRPVSDSHARQRRMKEPFVPASSLSLFSGSFLVPASPSAGPDTGELAETSYTSLAPTARSSIAATSASSWQELHAAAGSLPSLNASGRTARSHRSTALSRHQLDLSLSYAAQSAAEQLLRTPLPQATAEDAEVNEDDGRQPPAEGAGEPTIARESSREWSAEAVRAPSAWRPVFVPSTPFDRTTVGSGSDNRTDGASLLPAAVAWAAAYAHPPRKRGGGMAGAGPGALDSPGNSSTTGRVPETTVDEVTGTLGENHSAGHAEEPRARHH